MYGIAETNPAVQRNLEALVEASVDLTDDGRDPARVVVESIEDCMWLKKYIKNRGWDKTVGIFNVYLRSDMGMNWEPPANFRKANIYFEDDILSNPSYKGISGWTLFKQQTSASFKAEDWFEPIGSYEGIKQKKAITALTFVAQTPQQGVTGEVIIANTAQFDGYFHKYSANPNQDKHHYTFLPHDYTVNDIPAGFTLKTATFHQTVLTPVNTPALWGTFSRMVNDKFGGNQTVSNPIVFFANRYGEPMVSPIPNIGDGIIQAVPFDVITYTETGGGSGGGGGQGGGGQTPGGTPQQNVPPRITYYPPSEGIIFPAGQIDPATNKLWVQKIGFTINAPCQITVEVTDHNGVVIAIPMRNMNVTQAMAPGAMSVQWDGKDFEGKYYEGKAYVNIKASNAGGQDSKTGYLVDVVPAGGIFAAGFFPGLGKLFKKFWFVPVGLVISTGILYAIPGTRHLIVGRKDEGYEEVIEPAPRKKLKSGRKGKKEEIIVYEE